MQQDQAAAMLVAGRGLLDAMYSEFEDIYRGTREDIKKRQAVYFERIPPDLPGRRQLALDIGCGRGEFLELLTEHGFTAKGVDLNENMVTRCLDLGLDAGHVDALEYLKSLAAGSHSLISAFHVVEHLPHKALVAFLDEALRVLAPGGVLILETPNPKNLLVGSCSFYLDPTHLNPIPEQLLRFLVEARGFVRPEVIPLHPVPDHVRPQPALEPEYLNELLYGPQDYGVIAWKA
jgi:2-polyprenyl-3-methyl-5-hydroxy-6-metoxy-1,4-benzoquinol methylase